MLNICTLSQYIIMKMDFHKKNVFFNRVFWIPSTQKRKSNLSCWWDLWGHDKMWPLWFSDKLYGSISHRMWLLGPSGCSTPVPCSNFRSSNLIRTKATCWPQAWSQLILGWCHFWPQELYQTLELNTSGYQGTWFSLSLCLNGDQTPTMNHHRGL